MGSIARLLNLNVVHLSHLLLCNVPLYTPSSLVHYHHNPTHHPSAAYSLSIIAVYNYPVSSLLIPLVFTAKPTNYIVKLVKIAIHIHRFLRERSVCVN